MTTSSISRRLAKFVAALSFEELPGEVVERAKCLILDGLATAVAGREASYYRRGLELVKGNAGAVSVFSHKLKLPAIDAAFINSILVHNIGQSDGLTPGHPAAVVLPAVFAFGEEEGASGAEAITALVAGYDIFARIYLGAPSIIPRFRATPVLGPIAAAAAAGKLLKLDEDKLANALGIASNLSSGFLECYNEGTMESRLHAPMASRNGVTAAILARAGINAADRSFEGEAGFYRAFAGTNTGLDAATSNLGKRFYIMEATYKPFPCCNSLQGAVGLALNLARQHKIDGEIDHITENVPADVYNYPGTNYAGPFTAYIKAKMSAQFCAAAALLGKPVASFSFFEDSYADPEVAELARRVRLTGDKDRDATRKVRIEVSLKDGRQYSVEGTEAEMVPTVEHVKAKFGSLASGFLGKARTERVIEMVLGLDKAKNVRGITRELAEAAADE